ncbi:MAG: ferritin-like domain-containing protein, partial [Ilumatobacteraceae bacterium]
MTASIEASVGLRQIDRIHGLLAHPTKKRDMAWLEASLQSAVSVEFSTIPPYLSALWSIKDDNDEVAKSIRNVVQEEMLHMALACNMLTAVGSVPKIRDPHSVPSYPGHIPGAVHPELVVSLSGLSDESLDLFIAIEAPSKGSPTSKAKNKVTDKDGNADAGYKTIGAFYDAIADTFKVLNPKLSTERQVSGPLAYMVMEDLDAVDAAIALIKDQGEGSEASPVVDRTTELAHYYRF